MCSAALLGLGCRPVTAGARRERGAEEGAQVRRGGGGTRRRDPHTQPACRRRAGASRTQQDVQVRGFFRAYRGEGRTQPPGLPSNHHAPPRLSVGLAQQQRRPRSGRTRSARSRVRPARRGGSEAFLEVCVWRGAELSARRVPPHRHPAPRRSTNRRPRAPCALLTLPGPPAPTMPARAAAAPPWPASALRTARTRTRVRRKRHGNGFQSLPAARGAAEGAGRCRARVGSRCAGARNDKAGRGAGRRRREGHDPPKSCVRSNPTPWPPAEDAGWR